MFRGPRRPLRRVPGRGSAREEGPCGPIGQGLELGVYPGDRGPRQGTGQRADMLGCPCPAPTAVWGVTCVSTGHARDHGPLLRHTGRADGSSRGGDDATQRRCGDVWGATQGLASGWNTEDEDGGWATFGCGRGQLGPGPVPRGGGVRRGRLVLVPFGPAAPLESAGVRRGRGVSLRATERSRVAVTPGRPQPRRGLGRLRPGCDGTVGGCRPAPAPRDSLGVGRTGLARRLGRSSQRAEKKRERTWSR